MSRKCNKTSPSGDGGESLRSNEKDRKNTKGYDTCCEVFRNNTTAVEVIVKSTKSATNVSRTGRDYSLNSSPIEREDRRKTRAEAQLVSITKVMWHLKSQLETSTRRELQYQTENLKLRLENTKLRMLIESKTDLVSKLKKDFNTLKRSLKLVLKDLNETTKNPDFNRGNFCQDYEEFGHPRKKDFQAFPRNSFDGSVSENGVDLKDFDYVSTLRNNTVQ